DGDGFGITWWYRRPGRHLGLIGDEEVVQVAGNEASGGRLTANNIDDLVPVERPGVPEEGFGAVVVVVSAIHELPVQTPIGPHRIACHARRMQGGIADRPAGKGPRALAYIDLSIVAHPYGEQFQNFPTVVFIHGVFVVIFVVQPEEHGWVFGQPE